MFTPADRERVREALVAAARADPRISAAALTGSAALDREDRWSDVDLALSIGDPGEADGVVGDWSARMYDEHGAIHHVDVRLGATLFRVFLLPSTLQVDIAFWSAAEFGAIAPSFRLLFGTANERPPGQAPDPAHLIGMGWLYALHARSSIARGRHWQAEHMISATRDHVLALVCVRHGVPAAYARGAHDLPTEALAPLEAALVRSLDTSELERAFRAVIDGLRAETRHVDGDLADRLAAPLASIKELR